MSDDSYRREVGLRVREAMSARFGRSVTQRWVAQQLGIAPDALSRSLNGSRSFSTGELAKAAHLFDADLHWLITGSPDPLAPVYAARHAFDRETSEYLNAGEKSDRAVRDGISLAYRQAQPWLTVADTYLPPSPVQVRELLGAGFVRVFADRVEERLGVDVVRFPGLSTDYSLTISKQAVILLKTEANWFRSNWSLAHELGHLCLGHHDAGDTGRQGGHEGAANAFAADLLLPADLMSQVRWEEASPSTIAQFIWNAGVSTEAVRTRLSALGVPIGSEAQSALALSTQRLLNSHPIRVPEASERMKFLSVFDPIGDRMASAAERRLPVRLIKALREGIETGPLNTGTLAWLMNVDPDDIEIDQASDESSIEDLISALTP